MNTRHYKNHKYYLIYHWKKYGVICDDFDKLYDHHMSINNCQLCDIKFNKKIRNQHRCLDHDHKTGLYRQTICHKCNQGYDRQLPKKNKENKSGHKNISFHKLRNTYIYSKVINGKCNYKSFKTLTEALCFKYIQILKYQAKSI